MKFRKQTLVLLAILSIVIVGAMFLMSQEIIAQNNEIMAMRERIFNLELINGYSKDLTVEVY